ncbi:MAG: TetR/AcrR family transcriptional regulator [Streptosporangiaceae bacterium]
MDAALQLVAEAGFDRATMDAIAARAGASKATVYRHWPGKHELVADAIRRQVKPSLPQLPDTGTLRGDLLAAVEAMHQVMTSEAGLVFFGLLVAMRTDPELAALAREQLFVRRLPPEDNPVTRAVARGELPPGADPALLPRVAAPLINTRLMLMGGKLDESFLTGLVDDILIPLLMAGRRTSARLPAGRPAVPSPE